MKNSSFKRDIKAFGSIRGLVITSLLTAMSVVIGILCKTFLNFGMGLFRITFENFPIIISGLMFGPLVGGVVGFTADLLSCLLAGQSPNPIISVGAVAIGAISGFVSHYIYKKKNVFRVIISAIPAHIIGSMIIKPIGLYTWFGWGVLWRIPMYLLIAPVEIFIIVLLYKNKTFLKLIKGVETL